ncbi:MAG TPA: aspartyl protease family protein [Vicinamibacterales bacterium]|nr:aspartyl protease family protein [Vicinamibacterales bacterium]
MRLAALGIVVVGSFVPLWTQAPDDANFRELYDTNRWFELRNAIDGKTAPALYRGAVASAFNRIEEAEKYLRQAVRESPDPHAANEARGLLALLYVRLGRSSDAGRLIDDFLRVEPDRSDMRNLRVVFGAFADRPNQSVPSNQRATFSCPVGEDGVRLPASVNGRPVNWLLDTAANTTLVSESEARTLGLTAPGIRGQAGDLAGGATSSRSVVAARMMIGRTELRNVPMLVVPDGAPWNELKPGERGAIGLPVAAALQTIRWTSTGTCSTGPLAGSRKGQPNLAFDALFPLVQVEFESRRLEFILDTGNQGGTQLWERFARDFAELVKTSGARGTERVSQIGGSNEREISILPEISLRVGGFDTRLRPAKIFSRPVGDTRRHGNLGMDVLRQASDVTIDFSSMMLTLR